MTDQIEMAELHGQPVLKLQTPDGAVALISLFGAQLLSWTPAGGEDRLYLSPQAVFDGQTAIRGGVPVCFPQFASEGPLPKHGFARNQPWEAVNTRAGKDYAVATLRLTDTPASQALWPHPFAAELSIGIGGGRLDMELEVANTGPSSFAFTAALHTYLKVREVEALRIEGLRGLDYRDATRSDAVHKDTGVSLEIDDEVDRVYYGAPKGLLVREDHRALGIHQENFPDLVVWNPWEQKCAQLPDMPTDGFRRMLCIEAAAVRQPIELAPGADWWGRQTLVAL
ncbi:D-hexose-6-phosphate mutarotase [Zoogloea sp.]|uniref:D-hexose-6-phosphate mutarotase n=1 Tax=Zoogloea sp. TaxID=49181 RepID=UPI002604AF0B|nr:D-hexose-6-phosphate mutarotase [Zoogloea sp.]MDD3353794.1 D-hexose-6-phosphate mutarotase [Zoogloea sp.]